MSGGSSWRSPSTAQQCQHHDYADFAQEFLQRNPEYRQDYAETEARVAASPHGEQPEKEGLAGRWGLSFPSPPTAAPRASPALWLPSAAPDIVLIETADLSAPVVVPTGFDLLAEARASSERHLVFALGDTRIRLCLRLAAGRDADCLVILRDAFASARLAAAARYERVTRGDRPRADPSATPTHYLRTRLVQLLAIHDALDAGASSRDIAFDLVFAGHRPFAGARWKGSGERRHTLRLIAETRRTVGGGYRQLLLHG